MKGHETKERVLQLGIDQVSMAGLSALTLGQLAEESGLSKSGLFAHFRSKVQLQIELLDRMTSVADRTIVEPAMRVARGLPRLKALVGLWIGWSRRAGLSGGCPLAAAMFELDDTEGEVRNHAEKLALKWSALLSQSVREAVEERHLSADTDVDQFVWELEGIYLSHHVSSRFIRDEKADTRAGHAFESLIERFRTLPRTGRNGDLHG